MFARLSRTLFKGPKRAESSSEDDIELQTNNASDEERVYHSMTMLNLLSTKTRRH